MVGVLVLLAALGTLAFAAKIGTWPERIGAATIFVCAIATQTLQASLGAEPPFWTFVLVDSAQGLVLLGITVRSGRLWAGIAACSQSLAVALSLVRYFSFPLEGTPYLVALHLSAWVPILALVGGAIAYRWGKPSDTEYYGDPSWSH